METYLKPIVDDLQDLYVNGFSWHVMRVSQQTTKVHLLLCCCDTVARSLLQNFKQFNGRYGCSYCMHPGNVVQKGRGFVRCYPESADDEHEQRTHAQSLQLAEQAFQTENEVFGVKGPSMLYLLPSFDIITGCNPDYMHCILLGVVRQFCNLWFDSTSHNRKFYVGTCITRIDAVLCAIRPPSEIKRLPRSIKLRKYWKAAEWRSFLLLYSPVLLKHLLPAEYYKHWLLLVFAINSLMGSSISPATLVHCKMALVKFVYRIPHLYSIECVSYNVHLMTHLVQSVEQWGPLWATSAFVFEDANGKLTRMFHGTRHVSKQIFRNFLANKDLVLMSQRYIDNQADKAVAETFRTLTSIYLPCKSAVSLGVGLLGVGVPIKSNITIDEVLALERFSQKRLLSSNVVNFSRLIWNGKVLHTEDHANRLKSNNSIVKLSDRNGIFVLRKCIIVCEDHGFDNSEVFFILNLYHSQTFSHVDASIAHNLTDHVRRIEKIGELVVCRYTDFYSKVLVIADKTQKLFAVDIPFLELD